MSNSTLLRPGDVASRIGVSRNTVRRWAAANQIRSVSLPGGERRIPEDEVNRILGHGRSGAGG